MDPERASQPLQGQPRTTNDPTSEPSYASGTSALRDSTASGGSPARPQTPSTEPQGLNFSSEAHLPNLQQSENHERFTAPRPPRGYDRQARMSARRTAFNDEKSRTGLTVSQRLAPTIKNAKEQREKYARKVTWTGFLLNIAIGLQVLLGALTTAISAAARSVKEAQIASAVLGGLSTLVASYLARARGSGEPDLSILRVKDLEHFLRDANAFLLDHAHEYPNSENHLGADLERLRGRLEELLGNGSGERKLSSVGTTSKPPQQ